MKQWYKGLLILILLLTSAGCTRSSPTAPDSDSASRTSSQAAKESGERTQNGRTPAVTEDSLDTTAPDRNDSTAEIENFWNINKIQDLAAFFKHLVYSYKTERSEGRIQETIYTFTVLSEDEIDGKKIYHAASVSSASGKENRLEFWIGVDKPTLLNGSEVDSFYAMKELPLYFHAFEMSIVWREFIKKEIMRSMYGWNLVSEEVKPARIGDLETTVRCYVFEIGMGNILLEAANIGGKAIFTKYRMEQDDEVFEFEILKMVPQEALKQ